LILIIGLQKGKTFEETKKDVGEDKISELSSMRITEKVNDLTSTISVIAMVLA
jgi:hypothetical protein